MSFFKKKELSPQKGQKIRNDIILISAVLLIVFIASLTLFLTREAGDRVTVTVGGKLFGEYSLSEDRTVRIKNGDGYNLLIIKGGKARVERASCPDGICSSHRPIGQDGESIICLPNKVVIEVHAADKDQPDIVA